VLSSDRRNRSNPAARGGPILASHTAASRLMQQSGGAGYAAALVLAVQAFVANGGGRPAGCCIAGADGQSWPCRSAWLVTFPCRTVAGRSGQARGCRCFVKREVRFAPPALAFRALRWSAIGGAALRGAYARDPARDGGRSRVTAWSGGDRSGRTRLTGAGTGQQALAAERSPLEFRAMLGISIGSGQPDGIAS
jgi:hypothetical protein